MTLQLTAANILPPYIVTFSSSVITILFNLPVLFAVIRVKNYPDSLRWLLISNCASVTGTVFLQAIKSARVIVYYYKLLGDIDYKLSIYTNFILDLPCLVCVNASLFTFISIVIDRHRSTVNLEAHQSNNRNHDSKKSNRFVIGLIIVPWLIAVTMPCIMFNLSLKSLDVTKRYPFMTNSQYLVQPYVSLVPILFLTCELGEVIMYWRLIRRNNHLLELFKIEGYHQDLESRVSMKQTADVTSAMMACVILHAFTFITFGVLVAPLAMFTSDPGILQLSSTWISLILFVFSVLHPLCVIHGMANVRTQLGKMIPMIRPVLKHLPKRHTTHIKVKPHITKVEPVAKETENKMTVLVDNPYFQELEAQWTTKFHKKLDLDKSAVPITS